jgi:hypothetical protein
MTDIQSVVQKMVDMLDVLPLPEGYVADACEALAAGRALLAQLQTQTAGAQEENLGDAIRALIRGEIKCSDDLAPEMRPVSTTAKRAFGAVYDLVRAVPSVPVPAQPQTESDKCDGLILADGFVGGSMLSSSRDHKVTLHYRSSEQAEAAFNVISTLIDAAAPAATDTEKQP